MMSMADMYLLELFHGDLGVQRKVILAYMVAFITILGIVLRIIDCRKYRKLRELPNVFLIWLNRNKSWIRETVIEAGNGEGIVEQIEAKNVYRNSPSGDHFDMDHGHVVPSMPNTSKVNTGV